MIGYIYIYTCILVVYVYCTCIYILYLSVALLQFRIIYYDIMLLTSMHIS